MSEAHLYGNQRLPGQGSIIANVSKFHRSVSSGDGSMISKTSELPEKSTRQAKDKQQDQEDERASREVGRSSKQGTTGQCLPRKATNPTRRAIFQRSHQVEQRYGNISQVSATRACRLTAKNRQVKRTPAMTARAVKRQQS